MPLAVLLLLQLRSPASELLSAIRTDSKLHIILASIPQFHVIKPQALDVTILTQSWDLLLLLTSTSSTTTTTTTNNASRTPPPSLTPQYAKHIKQSYALHVGIPTRILSGYPSRNASLLASAHRANAGLTFSLSAAEDAAKSSSQNLELSPALLAFAREFTSKHGADQPVTMLNLLHFHRDGGKAKYAKYGQAFVDVAGTRGGDAKLVGNVVRLDGGGGTAGASSDGRRQGQWWNEFSLVHYPSVLAFCDMLAGADYQEINQRYRLGALQDTLLICTKEVELERQMARL